MAAAPNARIYSEHLHNTPPVVTSSRSSPSPSVPLSSWTRPRTWNATWIRLPVQSEFPEPGPGELELAPASALDVIICQRGAETAKFVRNLITGSRGENSGGSGTLVWRGFMLCVALWKMPLWHKRETVIVRRCERTVKCSPGTGNISTASTSVCTEEN